MVEPRFLEGIEVDGARPQGNAMATAGQGVIIKEVLCRHPYHDIR